ncbi:hypothetical protein [Bradyrhizobium elkanii]|uniref:hypothetical protein n=1 Tax=Bradyrhizobium elkanii TaxID=29448 RepID=UPI003517C89A
MGLTKSQRKSLEAEVISNDARLKLTRLVRAECRPGEGNVGIIHRNSFVNIARTVVDLSIYRLEEDEDEMYSNGAYAWHFAETELIMRRPDTAQLVETLADFLQLGMLSVNGVNAILAEDNASIRFRSHDGAISVEILSDQDLQEEDGEAEHPNIRLLVDRMETANAQNDFAAVLHTSATIFETLAKLVFNSPSVENETLGGFFDGYRQRSTLPAPILDYILEVYRRRNREPLAGHGATTAPTVSASDAAIIIEMTKMCIRLERRLSAPELDRIPPPRPVADQA